MLEVRSGLITQTAKLEKLILDYVRDDEVRQRFMTIPGVGPLTALSFKTFADRPQSILMRICSPSINTVPEVFVSAPINSHLRARFKH